jgi:hypothetical protein
MKRTELKRRPRPSAVDYDAAQRRRAARIQTRLVGPWTDSDTSDETQREEDDHGR